MFLKTQNKKLMNFDLSRKKKKKMKMKKKLKPSTN